MTKTPKLTDRQYETLIDIADRLDNGARTYTGEYAVDTRRYRRSTLNALLHRGLIEYLNYGFDVAITEAGQAIASEDAAVKANRLHASRRQAAFEHRYVLQEIASNLAQQLPSGIVAIGSEKDLRITGLIESCIVPAPQGCYVAEGVAIGGLRLTEIGKRYWAMVEPFALPRATNTSAVLICPKGIDCAER